MPFAIISFDKLDTAELRLALRPAHIAYMRANLHRVLASGGLLSDDGATGHGALIILDTDSREDAEAFVAADPFFTGGLYGDYTVTRWRKGFFDFKDYMP